MLDKATLSYIQRHAKGYVAHWIYTEHSRPVMLIARYDQNGNKTFRQFAPKNEGWIEGVTSTPYPLFGLNTLGNLSPLKSVTICEGEKCASLIHQLRWPCVTTSMGAKNISSTDFTPLRHFNQFVVLRDNDKPGINYVREIAGAIRRHRPDAVIYVCNLAPDVPGGDVIDWVMKYPLCGYSWNGFAALDDHHKQRVSEALRAEIDSLAVTVEDCPQVQFKAEVALFDGDPQLPQVKIQPVPIFPIDLLPRPIQDYITLRSRQMCIPADFQATTLLTMLGGLIGRAVQLDMRPGHGWRETGNVWAMLVGRPSARKSPVLRKTFDLLLPVEEAAQHDYTKALEASNLSQKSGAKPKVGHQPPVPKRRRLVTDDSTTPKLRELLSENPRGLMLRSDELKGQLEKFDRDGNEGDRSFIMQCWAGLGSYDEDRIARGSNLKIPLTLTWIGCIQPVCLLHYIRQSIGESKGADGLLQRFQVIAFPDFDQPYQVCQETMPEELEGRIINLVTTIERRTRDVTKLLTFSEEAQGYFDRWETALQQDCRTGGHPAYWESHLGKQPKLLATFCIILHVVAEVLEGAVQDKVSLATLKTAEKLVLHYLHHAMRCYASVESLEISDARKILEAINNGKLKPRFKTADIYRNELKGIDRPRATNALQLLQDYNCVVLQRVHGGLGKPAENWVVHPKLLDQNE